MKKLIWLFLIVFIAITASFIIEFAYQNTFKIKVVLGESYVKYNEKEKHYNNMTEFKYKGLYYKLKTSIEPHESSLYYGKQAFITLQELEFLSLDLQDTNHIYHDYYPFSIRLVE